MSQQYQDAMIDLELIGLEYGHAILQIGVALFNAPSGMDDSIRVHSIHPSVDTAINSSRCPDTEEWWQATDPELFGKLLHLSSTGPSLEGALEQARDILLCAAPLRVWADYAAFDIAHLQFAMQRCGVRQPWTHRQVHNSATLKLICQQLTGGLPDVPTHEGRRAHCAGSDALQQALKVQAWWRRLAAERPIDQTVAA